MVVMKWKSFEKLFKRKTTQRTKPVRNFIIEETNAISLYLNNLLQTRLNSKPQRATHLPPAAVVPKLGSPSLELPP